MGWVVGAFQDLIESVRSDWVGDLFLSLADHRPGIASSPGPLLKLGRDALRDLAGASDEGDPIHLGVDFSGGQRRLRPGARRARAKRR
eukprot:4850862-Pyramimonas_sp.AAC.1